MNIAQGGIAGQEATAELRSSRGVPRPKRRLIAHGLIPALQLDQAMSAHRDPL
jgi:hypothetical protein